MPSLCYKAAAGNTEKSQSCSAAWAAEAQREAAAQNGWHGKRNTRTKNVLKRGNPIQNTQNQSK